MIKADRRYLNLFLFIYKLTHCHADNYSADRNTDTHLLFLSFIHLNQKKNKHYKETNSDRKKFFLG